MGKNEGNRMLFSASVQQMVMIEEWQKYELRRRGHGQSLM
jgi:hypothetical protein